MKYHSRKIFYLIISLLAIICFSLLIMLNIANEKPKPSKIIATSFVGYDFARAVTGDVADVSMLLSPGAELHDYEPTPEDIVNIKKADLFIYNGGESDEWVEKILKDNEIPESKTFRMMDYIDLRLEDDFDDDLYDDYEGHDADDEPEYDEHVWTSPVNAIKIIENLEDKLTELYPEHTKSYSEHSGSYISRLKTIDEKIREIVANGSDKPLVFADRFPFQYFVDEYGLTYFAAFPGCSEETEASSKVIAFLIDKVKQENLNVILKIELTSDKLAQTIAEETGAKILELNSAHNISKADFDNGITYVDIMENNLEVIKEALK